MLNKQIHVASVAKAVEKAKRIGLLDLTTTQLFRLVSYYIDFTKDNKDYIEENKQLKITLGRLKYKYSSTICNYKTNINGTELLSSDNVAPEVYDNTIYITNKREYTFLMRDFLQGFYDANGDLYGSVRISVSPTTGILYYGGNSVSTSSLIVNDFIELPLTSNLKLHYKRTNLSVMTDSLLFRITDDNPNPLYSTERILTISGTNAHDNEPAVIGDITIYPDNRATTIISLAMLTTLLTPPYNDPEGDLIDAIRIDEISTANQGKYYLNGIEAAQGDIISRTDVLANLFTHEGADVDTVSSDVFSFSARDSGSKIWVQ